MCYHNAFRKRIWLATVLLLCGVLTPVFAETVLKAEVDKKKITTDEEITYKLTITSTEERVPKPILPDFKGFAVVSRAQSATTSFVRTNKLKSVVVYVCVLSPLRAGKVTIDPSLISQAGKNIISEQFDIEVTPGTSGPPSPPSPKSAPPTDAPPESDEPQVTL